MKDYKVYGIRHKDTKEPWESPKGKWLWQGIGQAKNSFLTHNYPKVRAGYFEQDDCEYEVFLIGHMRWEPQK